MANTIDSAGSAASADLFVGGGAMGEFMRTIDWSSGPVGPVEEWPQSLRTAVSICLASRFPILIWWGQELVMLYNDAYRAILGTTKHPRAMGQRGQECWPEIWDIIGPMLESVLSTGQATWSADQLLLLDRNGYVEECYFTFSYSPIRDESGGVGGIFTAVTETTGRVVGERRLRLLQELSSGMGEARSVEDACTIALATLTGAQADIPFSLLYLLDDAGEEARLMGATHLSTSADVSPVTVRLSSSKGTIWPFDVVQSGETVVVPDVANLIRPLLSIPAEDVPKQALVLPLAQAGQGTAAGVLIAGISSRRALDDDYRGFFELLAGQIAAALNDVRAHEEERKRTEALAALDEAKTAFFSNVSHEFRTPLTLLLGPLEDVLARGAELSPPLRSDLEIAHRNGLRLLKLVNSLLDFSRIESGRIRAWYEPVDLATLTTELSSAFRSAIERAGLRLLVSCTPLLQSVCVDRDMWEKIVLNLLSNAFKFTFEGEIAVRLWCDDDWVRLEVRDTGTGIPEEELPYLFERFHQVHGARSRTYEGTGIGLALVKELARLHGGDVTVESRVGEGTAFTVSIPTGTRHLPAGRIRDNPTAIPAASRVAPYVEEALRWLRDDCGEDVTLIDRNQQEMPASRVPRAEEPNLNARASRFYILVVDDNADMRDYLVHLLNVQYRVRTAEDGRAALAAVAEDVPDLILTDIMMPNLDGIGLLKALRRSTRTASLPVILLSARAGEEAAIEGLEAGADDYLVKPFTARELLARVKTHVELAGARREIERQKADFFAAAAHDLKTPLTSIKGFTQLLQRQIKRDEVPNEIRLARGLERIDEAATRMMRLINELLDVTRAGGDSASELNLRTVDLVRIARNAVADVNNAVVCPRVVLYSSALELLGRWDPDRLERVLGNVLSNAVKYSPGDTEIAVRLTVSDPESQDWVQLSVEDRGIGIPDEDLPRVFEPFYRAHNVPYDSHGSGIGLASVRQIIEQHRGTISMESRVGEGTSVTITLPRVLGNAAQTCLADETLT